MKIQSPWMGRVRGSAGNMTGSKVYDKNVLRAKAFEVSNPNTTAQQTERSFFASLVDLCSDFSEAQLRTLFPAKPKSMSRRNALTKQLSAAFTVVGTDKVLDFSKLPAIGNGEKINVPIVRFENGLSSGDSEVTMSDFGANVNENTNLLYVIFDADTNSIRIQNTNYTLSELPDNSLGGYSAPGLRNGYVYATCATDGTNVYGKSFGTFTIKTRADK